MKTISHHQNRNGHAQTTFLAVVATINAQRSVEIRLLGKDGWMPVGNVTIPGHRRIPKVGGVLEVKGLYTPGEATLSKPEYVAERLDVEQTDCSFTQLKLRPVNGNAH